MITHKPPENAEIITEEVITVKKLLSCLILMIFAFCGGANAAEVTRIHVVGKTDMYSDQQYKLLVRDWALDYIENHGYDDIASLEAHLNSMAATFGQSQNIRAERGIFPYSKSHKGGIVYPAGDYDALRIYIGAAEGRNWWGVLYPEESGIGDDVIYYSAIVNWIMSLFGMI